MSDASYDWGHELPRLSGPRVQLRMLRADDAPFLLRVFGDPEVMRYWSSGPIPDLAAARALFEEIVDLFVRRELFQWGIAERATDEVIGTCTLWKLDHENRRAEIGFAVARDRWGQGLASEALSVLFAFCFDVLGLHRLEADVDPRNLPSLRVLEKQGFVREGYLRERWQHPQEVQDAVVLGLLGREWKRAG